MAEHVLPSGVLELGDADAPHTLTIFTHHSCPYCQDVQSTLLPEVIQPFITSGKLRVQIVLLQMSKYPESALQAKALYCSATQQKGLLMHMMLTQKGIKDEAALMKEVKTLAFDEAAFKACLESPQSDSAVNMQEQMARSVGVTLVPSFLLDKTLSTGYPEEDALRADLENATE
jgi:protein-disulfide isomerase